MSEEPAKYQVNQPTPDVPHGLFKAAFDWIESAPHGDNCFVSDNYEGDPGNQCNCGKDSLLSAYEEFGQAEAPAVAVNEHELCPSCRNSDIYACTCPFPSARNHTPDTGKMVEPSEDAKRTLANPPERIYLQVGDVDSEFPGEIHWRDVTWCEDQIGRADLMYVRSDLVKPAKLVRLTFKEVWEARQEARQRYDGFTDPQNLLAEAIMDAMIAKHGGGR